MDVVLAIDALMDASLVTESDQAKAHVSTLEEQRLGESEGSETSGAVSARSLRCRSAVLRDAGDAHVGVVAESGNDVAACAA